MAYICKDKYHEDFDGDGPLRKSDMYSKHLCWACHEARVDERMFLEANETDMRETGWY